LRFIFIFNVHLIHSIPIVGYKYYPKLDFIQAEFYHSMSELFLPESDNTGNDLILSARIEALLFVAPGTVTPAQLAAALDVPTAEIEKGLQELVTEYQENHLVHGLRLQRHRGRVQLTTAPEAAIWIERFLGLEASARLSRAALETLAIVAYQQPVTRPQIEAIRGVSSDGVLKNLLSKGLVAEAGRAEAVGRPVLFITTPEFLQYFGLNSLEELPALGENLESSRL
jgi:segregation and condensation protein B